MIRRSWLAVASVLFVACGARVEASPDAEPQPSEDAASESPDTGEAPVPSTDTGSAEESGTSKVALTAAGSISVQSAAGDYEISLSILPRVLSPGGLYEYEGDKYPTTTAAREAVVDADAYPYGELAKQCAARHPEIVLAKPGDPESVIEKAIEAVAACAYSDFGIKPYWIPRLVSDVDICARKLGTGYRLPTVADFESISADERLAIAATLHDGFFNGLAIFVRAADGSIQQGDLSTGMVRKLSGAGDTYHYEGGASLRCFRR